MTMISKTMQIMKNSGAKNSTGKRISDAGESNPLGIYIHIPFCMSRCRYCGFYSQAVGRTQGPEALQKEAAYTDRLVAEILGYGSQLKRAESCRRSFSAEDAQDADRRVPLDPGPGENCREAWRKQFFQGGPYIVDSVFIGGGTPSILPAEYISRLLSCVKESFCLKPDAEITMEANPGTLTESKLRMLKEAGVNRLSLGLQSFDNRILKAMGRAHTAETFMESYRLARKAGFQNINLDLMFDFPGQRMEQWEDTLKKAAALKPEHISFYGLQIEEGTPLYEDYKMERIPELDEEKDAEMYFRALDLLKSEGYHHYEISNAALPGYECRHNLKYWHFQDYLGIGASASSFMNGVRVTENPGGGHHVNTFLENCAEYVFTALRTDAGVDLQAFRKMFGRELWEVFSDRREEYRQYAERGLVKEENGHMTLTREGIPVSNDVMALFV